MDILVLVLPTATMSQENTEWLTYTERNASSEGTLCKELLQGNVFGSFLLQPIVLIRQISSITKALKGHATADKQ